LLRQQATIVELMDSRPWSFRRPRRGWWVLVIEVPTREEALTWQHDRQGLRCAQEVREIMFDPES